MDSRIGCRFRIRAMQSTPACAPYRAVIEEARDPTSLSVVRGIRSGGALTTRGSAARAWGYAVATAQCLHGAGIPPPARLGTRLPIGQWNASRLQCGWWIDAQDLAHSVGVAVGRLNDPLVEATSRVCVEDLGDRDVVVGPQLGPINGRRRECAASYAIPLFATTQADRPRLRPCAPAQTRRCK